MEKHGYPILNRFVGRVLDGGWNESTIYVLLELQGGKDFYRELQTLPTPAKFDVPMSFVELIHPTEVIIGYVIRT